MTSTRDAATGQPTGWIGWIFFAGCMMVIGGILNVTYGLVAIVNDGWVVWQAREALLLDLTAWGWVHLIIGLVLLLAGLGVFTGNVLARAVGVVVAALSLIANFVVLPAYPIWSIIVLAIDVLVIYALTAHGRELRS